MNKTTIKFNIAGVGIAILGVIALYTVRYFNPENRQIREAERLIEELKRQEREDPYGGTTPEETLRLFIEALKKGDIELASKYFIWDKQEEWKKNLIQITDKKLLDEMVKDLQKDKYPHKIDNTFITYSIANDKNEIALTIYLKRIPSGIWKIQQM